MDTSSLLTLGTVLLAGVAVMETRFWRFRIEIKETITASEKTMDLKISEAVSKLKDERMREVLAENIALKDKNDRLKDAIKTLK